MKRPHRRQILRLAAGAAALPAVPRVARAAKSVRRLPCTAASARSNVILDARPAPSAPWNSTPADRDQRAAMFVPGVEIGRRILPEQGQVEGVAGVASLVDARWSGIGPPGHGAG
jgi:hypothetical protein